MNEQTEKIHELKILPEYFEAVQTGRKKFELRKNDRNFHTGDILHLREWNGRDYTGKSVDVVVTYILHNLYNWMGLDSEWCIMSIDLISEPKNR